MKVRRKEEGRWAWRLTGFVTLCVYIFMFAPILATVILSFNASMFGGFPMTGFSLLWYGKLMANEQVLTAFRTLLWIALVTAAVTTAIGVVTAFALVRFEFPGKQALSTLVILPALVPETILGVGLLVLIKAIDQPRTMLLLVLGHILLAVPYVVLITQARMVGIRRVYEEAALSLGASRFSSFREITLPLLIPAMVGGALLAFTISFDNTSASLFWRPAGVETMPTQILSMLKISISPEINALGAVKPGDYQVIHSSGVNYYIKYVNGGLTSEINEANIPNMANALQPMIDPFRKLTPKLSAVPYDYGTTGIAYNTKVISPEEAKEKGAALLLDKKYAGKVGGYQDTTTRVWYAALATGQDPNNLKDMDAIWAKVRETRDLAKKFWSSGAELMDLLSKGEIVVTDAWSGRVAALQDQGHPIGYLDPAGSYAWMEDMLILKGSPMAECEELINFMLDPATSIAVAEGQSYPPSLDPTKVKLTEKIEKLPAFDKTGTMKSLTFADPVYWATNEDAWTKQWNRISKGA